MTAARSGDGKPFGLVAAGLVGNALSRRTRALLERGDSPRSGERVWRNSYTEGTIEDRVWRPIHDGTRRGGKRWTAALLKMARELEYRTRRLRREKEPGSRNGTLGEVGLEVLAWLYETVDYATGRLEPAIATIAEAIGRSYGAVHEALCRLRQAGFLHWMRRTRPVDEPEPGGPRVEQVTNAYALLVPEAARPWLGAMFRRAPAPACEQDRRARERQAFQAMLAQVSATEALNATWDGSRLLGETLRKLAAAIDRRDLQKGESSSTGETGGSY